MSKHWYIVQTNARAEARAAQSLQEAGFAHYAPVERVLRNRHRGRDAEPVERPLFPGYLFVSLGDDDVPGGCVERFDLASMADGVKSFVGVGGAPRVVPDAVVEAIRAEEADGAYDRTVKRRAKPPAVGSRVTILSGVFKGWSATMLAHMRPDERVRVLLHGLGGGGMTVAEDAVEAAA